jgi:hypothetical protein
MKSPNVFRKVAATVAGATLAGCAALGLSGCDFKVEDAEIQAQWLKSEAPVTTIEDKNRPKVDETLRQAGLDFFDAVMEHVDESGESFENEDSHGKGFGHEMEYGPADKSDFYSITLHGDISVAEALTCYRPRESGFVESSKICTIELRTDNLKPSESAEFRSLSAVITVPSSKVDLGEIESARDFRRFFENPSSVALVYRNGGSDSASQHVSGIAHLAYDVSSGELIGTYEQPTFAKYSAVDKDGDGAISKSEEGRHISTDDVEARLRDFQGMLDNWW